MVEIAGSTPITFLSMEFNDFLFAPIGANGNGMYLTVVSALAQLDLDPWAEAAKLARLPGAIATQKLADLISRLPEIPGVRPDVTLIASRLTALLPGRARSVFPVRRAQRNAKGMANPRSLSAFFIAFVVVMGMQLIVSEFHYVNDTATPAGNPHTIASNSFPSRPPLFNGARIRVSGN
jgi:hypothetical protein